MLGDIHKIEHVYSIGVITYMKKRTLIAAAVLAASSLSVAAADVKWDQVGAGYQSLEIDDTPIKLTGLGVNGTKTFAENFFVTGSYATVSDDIDSFGEIDLDELRLGVGGFYTVASGLDVYTQLSFVSQDYGLDDGSSVTEDGYGLAVGGRYKITPIFEIGASVERLDVEDVKDTKISATGRLEVATNIDLIAEYSRYDEAKQIYFGATWYF